MAEAFTLHDSSGRHSPTGEVQPFAAPLATATEILTTLASRDSTIALKRRLIIDAEGLSFSDDQKPRLREALWSFIQDRRDSDDFADLVAAGAAVRKYVALVNQGDIESLCPLLESGHRAPVSIEIELEITKMIAWKLSLAPPPPGNTPELATRMLELARLYLHDRLLPRKGYAAVALNAVMTLVLLRSHVDEIIGIVNDLRLNWFKQLLVRRLHDLKAELNGRPTVSDVNDLLTRIENALSVPSGPSAA